MKLVACKFYQASRIDLLDPKKAPRKLCRVTFCAFAIWRKLSMGNPPFFLVEGTRMEDETDIRLYMEVKKLLKYAICHIHSHTYATSLQLSRCGIFNFT